MSEKYILKCTKEGFIKDDFAKLLMNKDSDEFQIKRIEQSQVYNYLKRYLWSEKAGMSINTIICENEYYCLNFIEDYANYYSRTYTKYSKICKRLHFFSEDFNKKEFEEMLLDPHDKRWLSYKGCIVIKPIKKGLFGITYIATYPHANSHDKPHADRYYTCLTEHMVNLFGHDLYINTMPFKEQDGAVASCATTALWMAFHKTAELFKTKVPSLSEITIMAGSGNNSNRIFPSKGLNVKQICAAISALGLTPEIQDKFPTLNILKCKIHAYLKCGIPLLLGMKELDGAKMRYNHLVTMNGYRYKENRHKSSSQPIPMLSDNIERFYVNDDQVGPFARMSILEEDNYIAITTSWNERKGDEYTNEFIKAAPAFIVVPITSVIRVPFEEVYRYSLGIYLAIQNSYYERYQEQLKCYCDVFLTPSNSYKKTILKEYLSVKSDGVSHDDKIKNFLMCSLPKYIWVIEMRDCDGKLIMNVIYDTVESAIDGTWEHSDCFDQKYNDIFDATMTKDNVFKIIKAIESNNKNPERDEKVLKINIKKAIPVYREQM